MDTAFPIRQLSQVRHDIVVEAHDFINIDISPRLRLISNVNYLEFDNLSTLSVLRNQRLSSTRIGTDVSFGIQYRPFFTQNVVVNGSFAALLPGKGLRELYGNAVDGTQYSALVNILLTF